jgi:peptide deformylase
LAVREILLLGNPALYEISESVSEPELGSLKTVIQDLHDTMMNFRRRYGKGRAIAAPQIGLKKRLIYQYIDLPTVFLNPVVKPVGNDSIEIWDDCMSFPELMVKVRRHRKINVRYRTMDWEEKEVMLEDSLSELLQHEYDHLEGILAVSRAIDGQSFALASQQSNPNTDHRPCL